VVFFGILFILALLFGPIRVISWIVGGIQGILAVVFGSGDSLSRPQSGYSRISGGLGLFATIIFLLGLVQVVLMEVLSSR